jgi:hypothetical protein
MKLNNAGLYVEPTYVPGGYKQDMRVRGEPWGYGSHQVQPGTYQLDPRGMAPTSTLGQFSPVTTGAGVVYFALGAGMSWASWKVAAQAFGGKKSPNWASGIVGVLGLLGGVSMMFSGGVATAVGAGAR